MISLGIVATKFHISLNVRDLARSIEFYRTLFDRPPAKHFSDYCKFEVDEPPLILSLVPRAPGSGASITHLGLSLPDIASVERVRERLDAAGFKTRTQEETMCGYARQHRCWVTDPDGNFWAIYSVAEDVDPRATRQGLEGAEAVLKPAPAAAVWEHFLTHPVPDRVPHPDDTVEEVRLASSLNTVAGAARREFLLREAFRVLRPGGAISVRGLMAERGLANESPELSGVVVPVLHVPHFDGVVAAMRTVGFEGVEVVSVSDPPRFVREGIALRDFHLAGTKPVRESGEKSVIYKGPFAELRADDGRVYPRGKRVTVPLATWDLLRRGRAAECFLFLTPDAPSACGSA